MNITNELANVFVLYIFCMLMVFIILIIVSLSVNVIRIIIHKLKNNTKMKKSLKTE